MSDFKAKIHQKSISAGTLPQAPLGELTALPRSLSCIEVGLLLREGRGRGKRGEGKAGGGGEGDPCVSLNFP